MVQDCKNDRDLQTNSLRIPSDPEGHPRHERSPMNGVHLKHIQAGQFASQNSTQIEAASFCYKGKEDSA